MTQLGKNLKRNTVMPRLGYYTVSLFGLNIKLTVNDDGEHGLLAA